MDDIQKTKDTRIWPCCCCTNPECDTVLESGEECKCYESNE